MAANPFLASSAREEDGGAQGTYGAQYGTQGMQAQAQGAYPQQQQAAYPSGTNPFAAASSPAPAHAHAHNPFRATNPDAAPSSTPSASAASPTAYAPPAGAPYGAGGEYQAQQGYGAYGAGGYGAGGYGAGGYYAQQSAQPQAQAADQYAAPAAPASPASNPFRQTGLGGSSAGAGSAPAQAQPQHPQPSAHAVADDLAGLDFSSSGGSGAGAYAAAPAPVGSSALGSSAALPSATGAQQTVAAGTYAPPAGPPPGTGTDGAYGSTGGYGSGAYGAGGYGYGGSSAGAASGSGGAPLASSAATQTPAQAEQTAADEALARRIEADQRLQAQATARSSRGGAALAGTGAGAGAAAANGGAEEEALWNTKDIYWRGVERKIITQNENGPCSLIALCNVLLLRGDLVITPADRPAVSYSYLSSLLAEYLLTRGGGDEDLSAALSILPRTQHGLDVNVRFDAVDSFTPAGASSSASAGAGAGAGAAGGSGELALFKLCGVKLVHGWLPDPSDAETYAAVTACGDYDKALDKVVEGDELAKGLVVESDGSGAGQPAAHAAAQLNGGAGSSGSGGARTPGLGSNLDRFAKGKSIARSDSQEWSDAKTRAVREALLIRDFLSSTSTQLSYHGLFVLAQHLQPGEVVALFRNSHLSVLYRRLPHEGAEDAPAQAGAAVGDLLGGSDAAHQQQREQREVPQLFTLATDSAFLMEDEVVWESLVDVDQQSSEYFDGKFRKTNLEGDWTGVDARGRRRPGGPAAAGVGAGMDEQGRVIQPGEDADFALASQLQEEEQRRAAMRPAGNGRRAGAGQAPAPQPVVTPGPASTSAFRHQKKSSGLGGLFGKKKNKQQQGGGASGYANGGAQTRPQQNLLDDDEQAAPPAAVGTDSNGVSVSAGGKKDKCVII